MLVTGLCEFFSVYCINAITDRILISRYYIAHVSCFVFSCDMGTARLFIPVYSIGQRYSIASSLVPEFEATLASALVADVVLAAFQCCLIWRSRSDFKQYVILIHSKFSEVCWLCKKCFRTTSTIGLLVLYTVTTGVLTR